MARTKVQVSDGLGEFYGVICGWCRGVVEEWDEPRQDKDGQGKPLKGNYTYRVVVTCGGCKG